VVYGFFYMNPSNLASFNPFQAGVLSGAFYIFFAYGGFARVAVVAEEVKDAKRNVPRAIMLSLAISTVVYILVGFVAVGLLETSKLSCLNSPLAPLTNAISVTGNSLAVYTVSAGGLIATASVLLTAILGVSRMAYAMARRKDLPQALSRIHSRYGTPHLSIWIVGAAMILLVLFVDITRVVAISNFALLFYYTLANVSALKLKAQERMYPKIMPVLGATSCAALLIFTLYAMPQAWIVGIATLAAGIIYYWLKNLSLKLGVH
jgi:APA family basic amino acid/polyamine antiporter